MLFGRITLVSKSDNPSLKIASWKFSYHGTISALVDVTYGDGKYGVILRHHKSKEKIGGITFSRSKGGWSATDFYVTEGNPLGEMVGVMYDTAERYLGLKVA
jgi:hypothetical protein